MCGGSRRSTSGCRAPIHSFASRLPHNRAAQERLEIAPPVHRYEDNWQNSPEEMQSDWLVLRSGSYFAFIFSAPCLQPPHN